MVKLCEPTCLLPQLPFRSAVPSVSTSLEASRTLSLLTHCERGLFCHSPEGGGPRDAK